MANFLVEAYASGTADLAEIEARAELAASDLSTGRSPVHHLRSIFVPADETCFHIFEAPSREAVVSAIEGAGLAYERVSETTQPRFAHRKEKG